MEEQGFKYASNFVFRKKITLIDITTIVYVRVNKYVLVPNQIHFTLREGYKNRFTLLQNNYCSFGEH